MNLFQETDVLYLLTVPSGTNSPVVVPDGDPTEGADQFANLHIENVNVPTLESPALQEDFAAVLQALVTVHDHVDLRVGASTPHISSHHLYIINDSYVDARKCKTFPHTLK